MGRRALAIRHAARFRGLTVTTALIVIVLFGALLPGRWQRLIWIDQGLNTFVWADGEGFGSADETLSARAWRLRARSATWGRLRRAIDALFWLLAREREHCRDAYIAEYLRRHLAPDYRIDDEN